MALTKLQFVFRQPIFPVICDFGGRLGTARSGRALLRLLANVESSEASGLTMIDRTAEEWSFFPEMEAVAPAFTMRTWKKRDIIALFNSSANATALGGGYPDCSLNNRTMGRIVLEIAALVAATQSKVGIADSERRETDDASDESLWILDFMGDADP